MSDVSAVNAKLHAALAQAGAWLDLVLVCPHENDSVRAGSPLLAC